MDVDRLESIECLQTIQTNEQPNLKNIKEEKTRSYLADLYKILRFDLEQTKLRQGRVTLFSKAAKRLKRMLHTSQADQAPHIM
jgi:hypothetical protein